MVLEFAAHEDQAEHARFVGADLLLALCGAGLAPLDQPRGGTGDCLGRWWCGIFRSRDVRALDIIRFFSASTEFSARLR
jgi:hypothetical protein